MNWCRIARCVSKYTCSGEGRCHCLVEVLLHDVLIPYAPGLAALSFLAFMVLLQALVSTIFKSRKKDYVPGVALLPNHADLAFRLTRAFENSVENLSMFLLTVVLAIVFSVDDYWVNVLVMVFVVARYLHWVAYAFGWQMSRSILYSIGLFSNLILAVLLIGTLLF